MATEIKMPQWAMTLSEGAVTEWLKKPGDTVRIGDALCIIEEAKTVGELSSTADGVLLKTCVDIDDIVPVLTTICWIGHPGETV